MTTAAPTQKKLIAITFDDGPSGVTGRLLDGLKARGAKATFFMLGSCASNYPSLVRRAYEEGHQICSHSYDHPALTTKTNDQVIWQMDKTDSILDGILGMDFEYTIRPPYGDINSRVLSVFKEKYHSPAIIWSVDPYDWQDRNSYTVANRVVSGSFDGSIVLVHDIYGSTVTGILSAIDTLKSYGYEFVTLAELFRRREKELTPGEKIYYCKPTGTDLGPVEEPTIYEVDSYGRRDVVMTAQEGASIYYTLDGSNPVYSKQKYTEPLQLAPGAQVRAVAAYNLNGSRSSEVTFTASSAPVLQPVDFEVKEGNLHIHNPNPDSDLRYTTDGSFADKNSTAYTEPLALFDGILRYRVIGSGVTGPEESIYVTSNGNLFRDVPTEQWYAPTVDRAVAEGLFNGMGNYRFAPNVGVNRAMFITVLYRLIEKLGIDVSYEVPASYPDATEEWYADALSWGTEQGIVNGYTDGSFKPTKEITREEMCVMLARVMEWYGYSLPEGGVAFEDEEMISSWALSDVLAMSGMDMILGYEDSTFRPQNTATRAQAATVLLRAYDYFLTVEVPEEPVDPEEPETPVDPETPVEPEEPADPEDTEKPEEPENPVDPEAPADPVNPETPAPTEPTNPEDEE